MVEVNLKEYAKMLIDNTNSNKYEWEAMNNDKYRLLMNKGSIVLEKMFSGATPYFSISFYSTSNLIYKASIYNSKPLYNDYLELFNTIISKNNEKINSAISDLFS